MKPKAIPIEEVVGMIPDGASLMFGGFMGVGSPTRLIDELLRQGKRDLTVIANDSARPGIGIGKLISARACPESRLLPDPGQAGGLPRQSGNALTARKFNPLMAMAADKTIAKAEDIVPVGVIPPDLVVTPGVLVHCLVGQERTR